MHSCLYGTRSCTFSDKLHIVLAAYLQGFVQQQNPKLDQWIILLREKVAVFVSAVKSLISVTKIPILWPCLIYINIYLFTLILSKLEIVTTIVYKACVGCRARAFDDPGK